MITDKPLGPYPNHRNWAAAAASGRLQPVAWFSVE